MDEDFSMYTREELKAGIPREERAEAPPLTGGSVGYYRARVSSPTSGGDAYIVECNDIIEALGMNYAEGNVLKALWRLAALRKGQGKPGNTSKYDAEKIKFFADRILAQNS